MLRAATRRFAQPLVRHSLERLRAFGSEPFRPRRKLHTMPLIAFVLRSGELFGIYQRGLCGLDS